MAPHCQLDTLPVELLIEIKDQIDAGDLRTHVFYCRSCPTVASAAYHDGDTEREEELWKRLVRRAGLSLFAHEEENGVSWKEIAFTTMDVDGFCEHPLCGSMRLDVNARYMSEALATFPDWRYWEPVHIVQDAPFDDTQPYPIVLTNVLTQSTRYIRHAPDATTDDPPTLSPEEGIYLRMLGAQNVEIRPEDRLWAHPMASRSLAVFPAAERVVEVSDLRAVKARNPWGVTVWDVHVNPPHHGQVGLDRKSRLHVMIRFRERIRFSPPGTHA